MPVAPEFLHALRKMTQQRGALLFFDEVITGFGRLGTPFAADYFGVVPDIMTTAKGVSNGVIPMGAVFVKKEIHDDFMNGPEHLIEFMHGYTYTGHPMAAAAVVATQKLYHDEHLFQRAAVMAPYFEETLHSLRGTKHVIDIRNLGLVGGIELESREGAPGRRGYEALVGCFEAGVLIRVTGDIIALSPPLIVEEEQVDQIVDTIRKVLTSIA